MSCVELKVEVSFSHHGNLGLSLYRQVLLEECTLHVQRVKLCYTSQMKPSCKVTVIQTVHRIVILTYPFDDAGNL